MRFCTLLSILFILASSNVLAMCPTDMEQENKFVSVESTKKKIAATLNSKTLEYTQQGWQLVSTSKIDESGVFLLQFTKCKWPKMQEKLVLEPDHEKSIKKNNVIKGPERKNLR